MQKEKISKEKNSKEKARVPRDQCVACGCCFSACPQKAIAIIKGVYAAVDESLCVGCGLCRQACPASIIEMVEVPA